MVLGAHVRNAKKRDVSERRCLRGCVSCQESWWNARGVGFLWSDNLFFVVSSCEWFMIAERHERAAVCDSFISWSERMEKYLPFLFQKLCLPLLKIMRSRRLVFRFDTCQQTSTQQDDCFWFVATYLLTPWDPRHGSMHVWVNDARRWRIVGPSCWQHGNCGSDEGQADMTRSIRRVWCVRDREFARGSREEASDDTLGSGPQNGRIQNTIRRRRIQGWRNNVCCVRSKLDSEHGTRQRIFESHEFVSHIHNRRDQPVFPRKRGRKTTCRIGDLCLGDGENICVARDALGHVG